MTKGKKRLRHEFVEFVPDQLEEGILYISIAYATASHKCCCGCGHEVVTPISPTDWSLSFDGVSVSLDPSIGNWGFACQSHYWIEHGNVEWAPKWSRERIELGRSWDKKRKDSVYIEQAKSDGSKDSESSWLSRFVKRKRP